MALANYTDLKASIAAWLHRSNDPQVAAVIPDWITLAEKRIVGDLDARLQDTVTTLTTVASNASVAAPTDVINIRSLTLQASPNRVLDYVTPDQFNVQYAFSELAMPRMYTVIGANIYLGPTPDAAYPLQCVYKALMTPLSDSNPTNALLTNYPDVYLFASLAASAAWTRDQGGLELYESRYAQAVQAVNAVDWFAGSTMRVRTDVRP